MYVRASIIPYMQSWEVLREVEQVCIIMYSVMPLYMYMLQFSVCNVWPLSYMILPACLLIVNQNIFPYNIIMQNVFILRSVSNSALSGAINSREFIDLVGNFSNWGGAGVYISSGKNTITTGGIMRYNNSSALVATSSHVFS